MQCVRQININYVLGIRQIHLNSVHLGRRWRVANNLPENKTFEGPLIDLPDYTFLDGRITPLGSHQKIRYLNQREYGEKMVKLISHIDFAKRRIIDLKNEEEEKRRKIEANRLKPKGFNLLRKKK